MSRKSDSRDQRDQRDNQNRSRDRAREALDRARLEAADEFDANIIDDDEKQKRNRNENQRRRSRQKDDDNLRDDSNQRR